MAIIFNSNEPAIVRGIKTVGVGKKGSSDLTPELAQEILNEFRSGKVAEAARGAFFAGLFFKGVEPQEEILDQVFERAGTLKEASRLAGALCSNAPSDIQQLCSRILNKETLSKDEAFKLGQFLMSDLAGDGARGLVASALRVRYETDDEYEGLLQAIEATVKPPFKQAVPAGEPVVQIAEPFDGVDHSFMLTPLLGKLIQPLGYRVVHLTGKNSGPKLVCNILDIAHELGMTVVKSNAELSQAKPKFGWVYNTSQMSDALNRWTTLRHQTVKRPFLSTLERFLNPASADILIASAFHPPYGEKMLTIAERAGFKGIIIVRNGIEGTIAFPLMRATKLLCSVQKEDGSRTREEITFDPQEHLEEKVQLEEKITQLTARDNANLISTYVRNGKTGNQRFDLRVKVTLAGLEQAMAWLQKNK